MQRFSVDDLTGEENPLASHYSQFRVSERLLLTGHSHQAWPDAGFEGQQRAWLDAAVLIDDKWTEAENVAERVRRHWQRLLADRTGSVALGQNTHELVTRFLSALPLRQRPRLITSGGEFHTIRRQLQRLAEEGLDVTWVPPRPVDTLATRLAAAVDDTTACVLVSSVLYETAEIVPSLGDLARTCETHGAELLVDAYHHVNVVPFDLDGLGLSRAYVTGGGYKYCQLGEGNAFLRVPPGCHLRPVLTGWFAEFVQLEHGDAGHGVAYGEGAARFAGATYDPTAHYRAAAVQEFHVQSGLTPELLHEVNRRQGAYLRRRIEAIDVNPAVAHLEPVPEERRGGFLAIRAPRAIEIVRQLRRRGVHADARGDVVRLGPAPYLSAAQLRDAVAAYEDVLRSASTLHRPPPRAAT